MPSYSKNDIGLQPQIDAQIAKKVLSLNLNPLPNSAGKMPALQDLKV
jgi:hypothetical protein